MYIQASPSRSVSPSRWPATHLDSQTSELTFIYVYYIYTYIYIYACIYICIRLSSGSGGHSGSHGPRMEGLACSISYMTHLVPIDCGAPRTIRAWGTPSRRSGGGAAQGGGWILYMYIAGYIGYTIMPKYSLYILQYCISFESNCWFYKKHVHEQQEELAPLRAAGLPRTSLQPT